MIFRILKTYFGPPSPRMMLTRQLEEAERNRINFQASAEHVSAMVDMLDARIARIERDLQAMSTNQERK